MSNSIGLIFDGEAMPERPTTTSLMVKTRNEMSGSTEADER